MTMLERLDAGTTALIVFDMQNGQIRVNDPERQRWLVESNIVANCVDLVDAARKAGMPIYYVRNNRRADAADQPNVLTDQGMRQQAAGSAGAGAPRVDNQWGIIDELKPQLADFVVDKIRMGAFSSTPLDTLLRAKKIENVIICGVRTTVGIATTVRDGRDLGYNMVVAKDATGGVAPEDHQWMIEKIFPMFSRVRTVNDIKRMLG